MRKKRRKMFKHVWLAVIAGGKGTRLFPISHEGCPKQFCDINESEKFIQATIKRYLRLGVSPNHVAVFTTNLNQTGLAKEQVRGLGVFGQNIYETDEAWGYPGVMVKATEIIKEHDPKAVVINTPSDQYLVDNAEFKSAVYSSIKLAQNDKFVVIGVKINDIITATGCGHVVFDPKEISRSGFRKMLDFFEKPAKGLAERLMRGGNSACNTGINVWKAETLLRTITPDTIEAARNEARERGLEYTLTTDVFLKKFMPNVYVTARNFPWYDCGTLNALYEISPKTPNHKNASIGGGKIDRTDCEGSLFYASKDFRLHATGLNGVCGAVNIAEINGTTRPICCVIKLKESQKVKELAEDIVASKHLLPADFQINARNNIIMRSNASYEMVFGFVGVENCIVNAYRNPDGIFDVYISQQFMANVQ